MSDSVIARVWRLPAGRIGLVIAAAVLATAAVALVWTPFDPQRTDVEIRWQLPSWPHLLGTDATGRDILSLLMAGARTTVVVAVGAGIIATVLGLVLAALGALTPRLVRESVAVVVDVLIAFPVLLIAMIGAITLTLRHKPHIKRQNITDQVNRSAAKAMEIKSVQTGQGVSPEELL